MSIQITLRVGSEYEGGRRFEIVPKDDKSEPKIESTTPKLAIPTGSLPPSLEGFQEPKRLLLPGSDTVLLKTLEYVRPGLSTPWAVEVKLRASESGMVILAPNGTAERNIDYGSLGRRDEQSGLWRLDGFVFDDTRRHRCEIIMSDPRPSTTFDAVGFVRKHYHHQLDPKPLKP